MDCKYYIDTCQYFTPPGKSFLIVSGWVFTEDGKSPEPRVILNGKALELKCQRIARRDIQMRYPRYQPEADCGFRFRISLSPDQETNSLKIAVSAAGKTKIILSLNRHGLNKIQDSEPLVCHFGDIRIRQEDEGWRYILDGWAISHLSVPVRITIRDQQGKSVDFTNRSVNRDDLCQMGVVGKADRYCGFAVSFTGSRSQTYYFVISDGTNNRIKRLVADEIEREAKKRDERHMIGNVVGSLDMDHISRGMKYLRKKGLRKTLKRVLKGDTDSGMPYGEWYEIHRTSDQELERQRHISFANAPMISVIVPTYRTPIQYLCEMIESVRSQTYANWELCIGDGSEGDRKLEETLEKYAAQDSRIHYQILKKNMGISGNSNGALKLAEGEYIALLDHDDILAPDAFFEVVKSLQGKSYDILYSDEDKVSSDLTEYSDPNFKPDYSEDLFRSHNYITHLFVVRRRIVTAEGGFRSEFDGAQDYDLMFRCIEKANGIYHIPKILYHWRMHDASMAGNPESKMYAYEAGKKAIEEHYRRTGVRASVEMMPMPLWGMYHTIYETTGDPLVSVVIPNKDHAGDLRTCLHSLYCKNTYRNFEVIIVENNSEKKETFELYEQLQADHDNLRVLTWKDSFNYAAINNFGVKEAKGKYLLFLNNDTEIITEDALSEMLGCCMRPEVGVVGAKLLYEDDTVQHAGIVIGFGGFAGHVFTGIGRDDYGFMVRACINCNYSAVTGACMMVDREDFDGVGGFSEEFAISLNDVDLCLKIRERGKLVVYNAHSLWYHYESKSRGYEDSKEKEERFRKEIHLFRERWADILRNGDPYYNKNFPIEFAPFHLG